MRAFDPRGLAILATAFAPVIASAQASDDWKWQAAIYGYLPDIGGTTRFPVSGSGSGVTVDAEKIIDSLKFTFMGQLEGRRGSWGVFTDAIYMDVGGSKSQSRDLVIGGVPLPAGTDANVNYDLKGLVWTVAGTYRLSPDAKAPMDLVFGTRLLDVEQTLRYELTGNIGSLPIPGRTAQSEASLSNWDAIVGVKGRFTIGDEGKWFAPYYFDVGTGESDLTWQAIAGIGYSFKWGDVVAAWRYVDYEMKSDKKIETLTFNGPAIAAVFRW